MKKLILIFASLMFVCSVFGQYKFIEDSIIVPTGTDTTEYDVFGTVNPWSIQFNFAALDGVDTLYVYSAARPSTYDEYDLLWVDQNLDGTNDNPWTLTDSSLTIWGLAFPMNAIVYKLAKGTSTTGKKIRIFRTKF
jgi:hypothetical protein